MTLARAIALRALRAIDARVFPGCVVGVVYANGERRVWPFGAMTYDAGAPAVREDTIYDLASVTKSIPTASLAALLVAEGRLRLDDNLIQFIPEFSSRWREDVTIGHLLRYELSGVRLSTLKDKTPDEILSCAYSRELAHKPGEKSTYTNLPALLLGVVIERIAGIALEKLARERLFEPLGMRATTFFPDDGDPTSIIAPTEIDDRGEVRGLPHDESAYVFAKARRAAGHAGLFSTAGDLLHFLGALLTKKYGFTKPIVEGAQKGLGWQIHDPRFMGAFAGARTFGKTGFTGTSVVCDAARSVAFVILSNRTYPTRPPDNSAIFSFRRDVADIIFG